VDDRLGWVAIDDDGCVGLFVAPPGDLVPRPGLDALDRFPVDALCAARARPRPPTSSVQDAGYSRALVVVDPALGRRGYRDDARELRAPVADAYLVSGDERPSLFVTRVPLTTAQRGALARDPTVLGVVDEAALRRWMTSAEDVGLFRWWSLPDASGAARYVRDRVPTAPLRIHELPEHTRFVMRRIRFPIRFATEHTLHLDDYQLELVRRPPAVAPSPPPLARTRRQFPKRFAAALGVSAAVHTLLALLSR
jgi:hypothetical protein